MARYFRCSEILSSDLKNVRLVEEADADTHIISRSLVDSWAPCTIWQCVVHSFTKKRTFPWNMVFPDRRGEKANQSVHQWPQEFCCSWCRMCCHIPLNRKIRKIQNSWNVPFPPVWLEKTSVRISLLKDPYLLCRFDKEIYLLEKIIAGICFVLVCGRQDCSEGTLCFQCISRHQETSKFGVETKLIWFHLSYFGGRNSYFYMDSSSRNLKLFFQPMAEVIWRDYIRHLEILSC